MSLPPERILKNEDNDGNKKPGFGQWLRKHRYVFIILVIIVSVWGQWSLLSSLVALLTAIAASYLLYRMQPSDTNSFLPGSFNYRGYKIHKDTFEKDLSRTGVGPFHTFTRILLQLDWLYADKRRYVSTENEADLRQALELFLTLGVASQLKGRIDLRANHYNFYYEHIGIERDENYLQWLYGLLGDLADSYLKIVALGGEAIPSVAELVARPDYQLSQIGHQLLKDIAEETKIHLQEEQIDFLVCPNCLTRFTANKIKEVNTEFTFLGCRCCSQSRKFLRIPKEVIAVLDADWSEKLVATEDGSLRVNWLLYQELFDFDQVEIVQAVDEDVKRFSVQIGNDTDELRRRHYAKMTCRVQCILSTNTIKILRHIFQQVNVNERGI